MNKTSGTITGARQHISRSGKFLMALTIAVAAAVGALVLFQPAAPPAAKAGAAGVTATSARLLALDQSLFAVVGTSDRATAHTNRLRAINASLYPADRAASASTRDQRLLDLNNRFYPAEAVAVNSDSLSLQQAEIASYDAHRDQWMIEWTAYYAKQLDALDAAARHALIEQRIAEWTEYNVTQPESQGPVLLHQTSTPINPSWSVPEMSIP